MSTVRAGQGLQNDRRQIADPLQRRIAAVDVGGGEPGEQGQEKGRLVVNGVEDQESSERQQRRCAVSASTSSDRQLGFIMVDSASAN